MSYKYFGLREEAFGIGPDLRFIYLDAARENISTHLTSGIHQGNGLMLLGAGRGMGKTVMLRYLATKLQTDGETDLLAPTGVLSCDGGPSFNDIVIACRQGFGVSDEGVGPEGDESHLAAILKRTSVGNAPSALLLDGVEHLSEQSLESIVALAALPAEDRGYLSIVLAGCLDSPERPINATLAVLQNMPDVSVRLQRLPDHDIEPFILHRLQIAGHDGSALFAPDAIDQVIRYSEGNPLAINRICRSAMVIASLENSRTVTATMVESALMMEQVANGRPGRASGDRSKSNGAPTESIEIPEMPLGPAGYVSGAATAESEAPGGNLHLGGEPDSGVGNTIGIEKSASSSNRGSRNGFLDGTTFWERSLETIGFLLSLVWRFLEKAICRGVQFAVLNMPRLKLLWQSLRQPTRGVVQFMASNKPRAFVLCIVVGMFLLLPAVTAVLFEDPPTQSSDRVSKAMNELLEEADRGSAQAQYRLGQLFEEGRGTPRDVAMAHAWYALAAAQGMPEASRARDALAGKMTREELSEAYRLAIMWTHDGEKETTVANDFPDLLQDIITDVPSSDGDATASPAGDATVVSNNVAAVLDPDAINGNVETAPNAAVESGNAAVIEALPDAGADVNAPGNEERKTPDTAAGRDYVVAYLVEKNADPKRGDVDGRVVSDLVPDERNPVSPVMSGTDNVTSRTERELDAFEISAGHEDTAGGNQFDTVSREKVSPDLLGATVGEGNAVAVTTPEEASQPEEMLQPEAALRSEEASQPEETPQPEEASQPEEALRSEEAPLPEATSRPEEMPLREATSRPEEASQPEETPRPEAALQQASRQPAASPTYTPVERTDDRAAALAASRKIKQARIKPDNGATARPLSPKPSPTAAKSVKTPPAQETQVKIAQYLLSRLGYDPGPADGLAGQNTRAAVRAYQRDKGEAADGRITEALVNRLHAEVAGGGDRRLAEVEKEREMEERREREAEVTRRRENKNVFANFLGGFQKVLGYEFNSTEDPDKMSAYCSKNVENWIYDFGTEQFVLCRDFVRRQPTVSR